MPQAVRIVQAKFVSSGVLQARTRERPLSPGLLAITHGVGQPLPPDVRRRMEFFFKTDFSSVRIHQGGAARSIGALAFTSGAEIHFAPGQYSPGTPAGLRLLGHELAHVVQQRSGRVRVVQRAAAGVLVVDDPLLEAEAERLGTLAAITHVPLQAKLNGARGRSVPWLPAMRAIQCMDEPTGGRSKLRWEAAKRSLAGLPDGGDAQWLEVSAQAKDINELETLVQGKLDAREKKRKEALATSKLASQNKHQENIRLQQEEAAKRREDEEAAQKAREKREAEALQARIARQQPIGRRRMESLARLLESPANVCVALVQVDGKLIAATNEGTLSQVTYQASTLGVERLGGHTGVGGERSRERDAHKLSKYVADGNLGTEQLAAIQQVGAGNDNVHAEMKILNWLVNEGKSGTVEVYVSKLCCNNCRIAIDAWNASGKQLIISTPGGHGNYFKGWEFPKCIKGQLKASITAAIRNQESDTESDNIRGRSLVREGPSQRERSISPHPTTAKVAGL